MKSYILSEADFERLLLMIDRDPKWGRQGGSSQSDVRSSEKEQAHQDAHGFYNYQLRTWIDSVKK